MNPSDPVVIGLDLSLTSTGGCLTIGGRVQEMWSIPTTGKKSATLEQRADRLGSIANRVIEYVKGDDTDLVVIEGPSYGSRFGSPHDRSGLWWLVVRDVLLEGVPVAVVAPQARAKYGTGSGGSKKDVVLAHVIERYADVAPKPKNDDEADALLLASMGSRHLGFPVEPGELPEANLASLDGVAWPTV